MLSDKEREIVRHVRKRLLEKIEYEGEIADEKMEELVISCLEEEMRNDFLPYHRRKILGNEIFN